MGPWNLIRGTGGAESSCIREPFPVCAQHINEVPMRFLANNLFFLAEAHLTMAEL